MKVKVLLPVPEKAPHAGEGPITHYSWVCDCHKGLRNVTLGQSALERKAKEWQGQVAVSSGSPLALTEPLYLLKLEKGFPASRQGWDMEDPWVSEQSLDSSSHLPP